MDVLVPKRPNHPSQASYMGGPYIAMMMGEGRSKRRNDPVEPPTETCRCGVAWRRHRVIRQRCVGAARGRRAGDQKRGSANPRGGSVARSVGLGRSHCSGCGRRGACRGCACCALLRLWAVLPWILLPGPGACVLRVSAAGTSAWLSSVRARLCRAWLSSAGTWTWVSSTST